MPAEGTEHKVDCKHQLPRSPFCYQDSTSQSRDMQNMKIGGSNRQNLTMTPMSVQLAMGPKSAPHDHFANTVTTLLILSASICSGVVGGVLCKSIDTGFSIGTGVLAVLIIVRDVWLGSRLKAHGDCRGFNCVCKATASSETA